MKLLSISPKASSKVARGEKELSEKDVLEIPKGLIPGEWILLVDTQLGKQYVGYCNPYSENFFKIKILLMDTDKKYSTQDNEQNVGWAILERNIVYAINLRKKYHDYHRGSRLVHGLNDSLPGLIVDSYTDIVLIQINTAGIDRFREAILKLFKEHFPKHEVHLFDNATYRKAEVLPMHEVTFNNNLAVEENGLRYCIPANVVQKIGYYYDHRENRNKLKNLILRLNHNYKSGLDLFSYVGSWGLHLLQAGLEKIYFVDQADMQEVTSANLKLNGFEGRGVFTRQDVFKYIDQAVSRGEKFDVVVSDPPAFTKSEKNKVNAIQGYEKLHSKALRLVNDGGLMIVASCTHYVSFEELDKTVQEAAFNNRQSIQLLDLGIQGFDHPVSGFKDKSFYIKYLAYTVYRG